MQTPGDFQASLSVETETGATYGMSRTAHVNIEAFGVLGEPNGYWNKNALITCQMSTDIDSATYAWNTSCEAFQGMNLAEAAFAVRHLTAIAKKMAKIATVAGEPATYGAYVQRTLTALGVKVIRHHTGRMSPATGQLYRDIQVQAIGEYVDRMVRDAKDTIAAAQAGDPTNRVPEFQS